MPPDATRPPTSLEQIRCRLAAEWEACLPRFRSVLIARLSGGGRVSREIVDDLVAEVTREVLAKAMQYDPQRGLIAWGMGFAKRLISNRPRRRQRERRQIPVSELGATTADALLNGLAAPGSDDPQRRRLTEWLERLPDPERRLIELRYFENLTAAELAAACELPSAGAARVRLTRALSRLRKIAEHDSGATP